jgi:hypothetical protein
VNRADFANVPRPGRVRGRACGRRTTEAALSKRGQARAKPTLPALPAHFWHEAAIVHVKSPGLQARAKPALPAHA